ncbi:DUF1385 domain-containing protein [Nanoarchaeota archaeon]
MAKKVELMVGGQAIIEGVMMRSPNYVGMAVRKPKGGLSKKVNRIKKTSKFWKIPFFRGVHNLWVMLVIGIKALNWSANESGEEEEKLSDTALYMTMAVAFLFGIGLFVLLPYALTFLFGVKEETTPILFNFIDGVIKVCILILYVYLIGLMKDVRTLYKYHGAEHKTVFCYENNKPLTVKNVKKYSTKHPRCGTSFLFIVIIISIVVFSFTPFIATAIVPNIGEIFWVLKRAILFSLRIALLPVIAGISYEFLKGSAKFAHNPIFKYATYPGLWLQKITTKEPTDKQIQVAIESLKLVIKAEGQKI